MLLFVGANILSGAPFRYDPNGLSTAGRSLFQDSCRHVPRFRFNAVAHESTFSGSIGKSRLTEGGEPKPVYRPARRRLRTTAAATSHGGPAW